ncbi:disulfide bond formation protein B [Hydrogenophaga sp.]|uniref:disulfide bond formation protein B n=1 Tax=Hydrogenophaga sp. TaxID=1904254 RepID=UPI002720E676|nr:disulfide bond formation protein B [Hydrogenophaga sp.]MDO9436949.1 disulfide bond formation protein B [Hydrogenophaga sp.]
MPLHPAAWRWLVAAWLIAMTATLGALFIGEVMGMTPCLLCWYQRICMFPLAAILGMAAFMDDRRGAFYALPLAVVGLGFAAYHSALVLQWVPVWWLPCGAGPSCSNQALTQLHGVQLPFLSLVAFIAIVASLCIHLRKTRP